MSLLVGFERHLDDISRVVLVPAGVGQFDDLALQDVALDRDLECTPVVFLKLMLDNRRAAG